MERNRILKTCPELLDLAWDFSGGNDAEAEIPVLWPPHVKSWLIGKDPDAGRNGGAGGEGHDRGWDGWMASLTRWMWVWVNSGSWWWTGCPGVLQFMGSQRVGHDWVTELNGTDWWLLFIDYFIAFTVSLKIDQMIKEKKIRPYSFKSRNSFIFCFCLQ